jgi:hypothetical protein
MSARTILNPPLNTTLSNIQPSILPTSALFCSNPLTLGAGDTLGVALNVGNTYSTAPTSFSVTTVSNNGSFFTIVSFSGDSLAGYFTNPTATSSSITGAYVVVYGGVVEA